MPPFLHDVVSKDEIEFFDSKSVIGWDFMTRSLRNDNNQIHGRIESILKDKEKRDKHKAKLNPNAKKKKVAVEDDILE